MKAITFVLTTFWKAHNTSPYLSHLVSSLSEMGSPIATQNKHNRSERMLPFGVLSLRKFLSNAQPFLPVIGSFVGIFTILLVYLLTWKAGRLPDGAITPPISLMGCNAPEHLIYQLGFSLTGTILLVSIQRWRDIFYPHLIAFGSKTAIATLVGGYLAAAGVAGQGLVTLEEDFLVRIKMGLGLSHQSVLHQQLAGIFFLGAATHCYVTTYYIISTTLLKSSTPEKKESTDSTHQHPQQHQRNYNQNDSVKAYPSTLCCYGSWSIRLKLLCVITSLLSWPIAEGLHPARTASLDKRNLNIAGLAQYIAVASYIIFFGSYTLDFTSTRITEDEQKTVLSKQS